MVLSVMRVTNVVPRGGLPGEVITITGALFGAPTGVLTLDPLGEAVAITPTSWTNDTIVFTVPVLPPTLHDRTITLLIERSDEDDSVNVHFWVPSSTPTANEVGYQYPVFEAGAATQDEDDPLVQSAADFNRVLDRVNAVGADVAAIEAEQVVQNERLDDLDAGQLVQDAALAAEIAARAAAVAAEAAARAAADTVLATAISSEATTRAAADTALDGRVTTLEGNPVLPATANQQYAVLQENPGNTRVMALLPDDGIVGGFRAVADVAARDAIPAVFRTVGMLVWCAAEVLTYQLQGGITNASWVEYATGGGAETVDVFTGAVTNGQTVFALSAEPITLNAVKLFINGVMYTRGSSDFTLSGPTNQVLTWIATAPVLVSTDKVEAHYPA